MEEKCGGVWIWLQNLYISGNTPLQIFLSLSFKNTKKFHNFLNITTQVKFFIWVEFISRRRVDLVI